MAALTLTPEFQLMGLLLEMPQASVEEGNTSSLSGRQVARDNPTGLTASTDDMADQGHAVSGYPNTRSST